MAVRVALSRRFLRDLAMAAAVVAVAAVGVRSVRDRLSASHARLRETTDVYMLPPPKETVALSFGYRSVLADILWANVLVSQGLHTFERRRFANLTRLLDTINELDPSFRSPYILADPLVTMQGNETPLDEVRKAREILERGVKNRPFDAELWLTAGQFLAYIGPAGYIKDPVERQAWRLAGAAMLVRAAELSGDNGKIAWQALGAARLLSDAGQREAEIRFLERTLAVTEDPMVQHRLKEQLEVRLREQAVEERDNRFRRLDEAVVSMRHADLPFVSRRQYMVLGPHRDPAYCAGPTHELEAACAPSFREWEERSMPLATKVH